MILMETTRFDVLKEILKSEIGLERMRVGKDKGGVDPITLAELLKIAGNLTASTKSTNNELPNVVKATVTIDMLPAIISWAGVVNPDTTHCRPN
jgi:hypothetical protein